MGGEFFDKIVSELDLLFWQVGNGCQYFSYRFLVVY